MSHTRPRRPAFGWVASALVVLAFTAVLTLAPAAQAATAPWLNVEKYYFKLKNCTRTGGCGLDVRWRSVSGARMA